MAPLPRRVGARQTGRTASAKFRRAAPSPGEQTRRDEWGADWAPRLVTANTVRLEHPDWTPAQVAGEVLRRIPETMGRT